MNRRKLEETINMNNFKYIREERKFVLYTVHFFLVYIC